MQTVGTEHCSVPTKPTKYFWHTYCICYNKREKNSQTINKLILQEALWVSNNFS